MVYNAAKRDGMPQLYELIGDERHSQGPLAGGQVGESEDRDPATEVGDSAMITPTPSTSAGSESDSSELSESKGKQFNS